MYVQLKDSPYEKLFIDMNVICSTIERDICFKDVEDIHSCFQLMFILVDATIPPISKGYGKKTFLMYLENMLHLLQVQIQVCFVMMREDYYHFIC